MGSVGGGGNIAIATAPSFIVLYGKRQLVSISFFMLA